MSNDIRKIQKSLIDIPDWFPRRPEPEDNEENLRNNIKSIGLLNPITVMEKDNGRFDLIAGSRRLKASDGDEMWVFVENKNLDEFDARIIYASDNVRRLDVSSLERDDFYYRMYKKGIEEQRIKSVADLAKLLGKNEKTLRKYILAGKEKSKEGAIIEE
jgi:ParB family chromosome partitioning protein